jgi:hypothetical protein
VEVLQPVEASEGAIMAACMARAVVQQLACGRLSMGFCREAVVRGRGRGAGGEGGRHEALSSRGRACIYVHHTTAIHTHTHDVHDVQICATPHPHDPPP